MAARLLDSNGNLKPFEQWKAEVLPIASHQCGPWLETEYNTAVLRARQTAQWQQFLAEKDVIPNLKWLPSTSPNPGADHRLYWNTILPIGHPFWDQHCPGDRWNCKCSLTSTDEPPTPVPSEEEPPFPTVSPSGNTPNPGLAGNPAKTRAIFSQDHPYFPKDCNHCAFYKPNVKSRLRSIFKAQTKDCYNCPYIDGCIDRENEIKRVWNEKRDIARKAVQGKFISHPIFNKRILISGKSIKEWLNQPFIYTDEKFEILLDIEKVLGKATYMGPADKHDTSNDRLVQSHIFKTQVKDIDAFIVVWEYDSHDYILHSISDRPSILNTLKNK